MVLLEHGEHLETSPAAAASDRLRVVGDVLQLAEHEPRHDEGPPQEAGRHDVHEAAVDEALVSR